MIKTHRRRVAAIAGLAAACLAAGAPAATITWSLSDADMPSYLFGTITQVTGSFTTDSTDNSFDKTTSDITVTDPYGKSFNFSGPIGGPDYMQTFDTGYPCVIAGCTGDIIGIAYLSIAGLPAGKKPVEITAEFEGGSADGDYGGTILATPNVPEPASWALMTIGFGGLGAALRSIRRAPSAA
jgi:hypothetical protein